MKKVKNSLTPCPTAIYSNNVAYNFVDFRMKHAGCSNCREGLVSQGCETRKSKGKRHKHDAESSICQLANSFSLRWRAAIKLFLSIPIWIPSILERVLIRIVLVLRRIRYGYPFRRIALTQGKYATVDPDDFDWLSVHKWYAIRRPGRFYAGRAGPPRKGKAGTVILMHRQILKVGCEMVVDHINHDGLDNRRANLRPATVAQNSRNRRKVKTAGHYSKYKGLTWYKRKKRWGAMIMTNRKSKFLGYFDDEIEAARAYDTAARELHGQFAALNFPKSRKRA